MSSKDVESDTEEQTESSLPENLLSRLLFIFSCILLLIFLCLLGEKLDGNITINYYAVFSPIWIFFCSIGLIILYMVINMFIAGAVWPGVALLIVTVLITVPIFLTIYFIIGHIEGSVTSSFMYVFAPLFIDLVFVIVLMSVIVLRKFGILSRARGRSRVLSEPFLASGSGRGGGLVDEVLEYDYTHWTRSCSTVPKTPLVASPSGATTVSGAQYAPPSKLRKNSDYMDPPPGMSDKAYGY